MKYLLTPLITMILSPVFTQELLNVTKSNTEDAFNTKYLGSTGGKHILFHFNDNVFKNDLKDVDQDKISPKPEFSAILFNESTDFEKKIPLDYEYKLQDLLFAGLLNNQIGLIYTSRKAKGTVYEKFDLNGNKAGFDLISGEKNKNYIHSTDSNKFILHFTKEDCYVFDHQMKNLDKFPLETDSILEIKNYKKGFLLLHRKDNKAEIIEFSPNTSLKRHSIDVSKTWICKSPRLTVDAIKPERFYVSYLIGKVQGKEGGWDFLDTRLDAGFRSKGVDIIIFEGLDQIIKERTILFESNIVYATNPNANSEQNFGCTSLRNLGIKNFENSLLVLLEEQTMDRKETINQLTGAKKVDHSFSFNDIILIKVDRMTSIQNFLIKACDTKMADFPLGSFYCYFKGNKVKLLFNQTYIRENKNKLLNASLDMYLETENKTLLENFNQHDLNLVLNPDVNYVKSKYFLALQNGFLDLVLLQE